MSTENTQTLEEIAREHAEAWWHDKNRDTTLAEAKAAILAALRTALAKQHPAGEGRETFALMDVNFDRPTGEVLGKLQAFCTDMENQRDAAQAALAKQEAELTRYKKLCHVQHEWDCAGKHFISREEHEAALDAIQPPEQEGKESR